jgi:hypothetical protein
VSSRVGAPEGGAIMTAANAGHIALPDGVSIRVQALSGWGGKQVTFTCRGTTAALVASGYLTHSMISTRRDRKRGSGHKQLDENGGRFWMHPSPSKASPERMMLVRRMSTELAMQMPGVCKVFPEGIPAELPRSVQLSERHTSAGSIEKRAKRLQRALTRRYPGLFIDVHFIDQVTEGHGTYRGWHISFESTDPSSLVKHRLTPENVDFQAAGPWCAFGVSEFAGMHWHTHDVIDQSNRYAIGFHIEEEPHNDRRDSAMTKTIQSKVMRMLKPFIRGTWKPSEPA